MKYKLLFCFLILSCNLCYADAYYQIGNPIAGPIAMPNPVYEPVNYQTNYSSQPVQRFSSYIPPITNNYDTYMRDYNREQMNKYERDMERREIIDALDGLGRILRHGY